MSSRFHIFFHEILMFLRKRTGAVGGDTIFCDAREPFTHIYIVLLTSENSSKRLDTGTVTLPQ